MIICAYVYLTSHIHIQSLYHIISSTYMRAKPQWCTISGSFRTTVRLSVCIWMMGEETNTGYGAVVSSSKALPPQ